MNQEEKFVQNLAIEHYRKQGLALDVGHIIGYAIAGSAQVETYMMIGNAERPCHDCNGSHNKVEVMLFLRIGRGFTLLEEKGRTRLHEKQDVPPIVKMLFFGLDE